MPSPRRFEGTDVETLLDRVHRELGPDAQIVEANRLRKGGIGGFFARESFEIVAEGGDGSDPDVIASAEADADTGPAPTAPPPLRMAHADRAGDDEPAGGTGETPTVSTETASFAEILDRLARETVEDDDPDPDDTPPAVAARPTDLYRTRAEGIRQPSRREPAAVAARTHVWPRLDDVEQADELASPGTPPPAIGRRPATIAAPIAPVRAAAERSPLVRLGLPPSLVPVDSAGRDVQVELARRLHALPDAPEVPTGVGTVVAVVGAHDDSIRVARDLARELAIDPDNIVVAMRANAHELPPWLHVGDARAAAQRRRSWWRRERVTVVAVESSDSPEGSAWARAVVDALEPTLTWGVVDATRKAEDVAAWADRLGSLDAIALENLRATVSPASILHVGIPVARLDGRRATPERWAQLLAERLAA